MSLDNGALDERILILAPHGRDAEVIHQVLARNGFGGGAVASFDAMVTELLIGAGACVIAEEALQDSSVNQLAGLAAHAGAVVRLSLRDIDLQAHRPYAAGGAQHL